SELVADEVLTRAQWRVLRDYVLLEYFFVFAYNDMAEHHSPEEVFELGDHEGDIEGFGVVFHRGDVASVNQQRDRLNYLRNTLRPRYFVASAHAHWQGLDRYRPADDPGLSLEQIKRGFIVWVTPGSHGTFLYPGEYPLFDSVDQPVEAGSAVPAILL